MLDTKEPTLWSALAAAVLAAFIWFRHFMRRDKEDISSSSLNVAITDAAKGVIGMLEKQVATLIEQVQALRAQVEQLINQNHECERQNQMLIGKVTDLNKRVSNVEKDTKP
jgi:predicted RNase H-like nuclease (RuvC/YqgF family)